MDDTTKLLGEIRDILKRSAAATATEREELRRWREVSDAHVRRSIEQ